MRIRTIKPELLDAAIAGFFLGEGHLDLCRQSKLPNGLYLRARIALRSDDQAVLDAIRERLGGCISSRKSTRSCELAITGCARVGALLDLLEECPLPSKKRREVELMREAQSLIGARGRNRPAATAERLAEIREERKRARAFK